MTELILNGLKQHRHHTPMGHPMNHTPESWEKEMDEMIEGWQAIWNSWDGEPYTEDSEKWKETKRKAEKLINNIFDLWW
jgi:hypothetical protein